MKSRLLALGVVVLVYVLFALTFYNRTVSRYSEIINNFTEVTINQSLYDELQAKIELEESNGATEE